MLCILFRFDEAEPIRINRNKWHGRGVVYIVTNDVHQVHLSLEVFLEDVRGKPRYLRATARGGRRSNGKEIFIFVSGSTYTLIWEILYYREETSRILELRKEKVK